MLRNVLKCVDDIDVFRKVNNGGDKQHLQNVCMRAWVRARACTCVRVCVIIKFRHTVPFYRNVKLHVTSLSFLVSQVAF